MDDLAQPNQFNFKYEPHFIHISTVRLTVDHLKLKKKLKCILRIFIKNFIPPDIIAYMYILILASQDYGPFGPRCEKRVGLFVLLQLNYFQGNNGLQNFDPFN